MFKRFDFAIYSVMAAAASLVAANPAAADSVRIDQISSAGLSTHADAAMGTSMARIAQAVDVGQLAPQTINPPQLEVSDISLLLQRDTVAAQTLVEQTGAGDQSLIVQGNSLDGGGLYAEVHQTAPNARSEILQSGGMNTAIVFQTVSAGASSFISQSGLGNSAFVRQ